MVLGERESHDKELKDEETEETTSDCTGGEESEFVELHEDESSQEPHYKSYTKDHPFGIF